MAESPLYFKQIEIGPMQNFTYLIGDPVSREALVVDAAWDIPAIVQVAEREGYSITKALVTHYHQDHLGGDFSGYHIPGAAELLEQVKAKVYIHKAEAPFLSRLAGLSASDIVQVNSGDTTNVGSLQITFIHTPGHTPGSQCFLIENRLVAGDTLFINSCGRVDLPGSSPEDLYYSLQKLANLPDDTVLYPGHNYADRPFAQLVDQKRHNMYLNLSRKTLQDFLAVMG
ncbi:MAG TPA: MBL fold metallo-hydrolase [Candidatus Binatia bacterium]|nr:MBL fold metallo-hydrolase [Candidatus Binatia bacterium]